jgi:hypothetical protein
VDKIRTEPAVTWGVIGSILLALGDYFQGAESIGWPGILQALVPLVVGLVIRPQVSPVTHPTERRKRDTRTTLG